MKTRKIDISAIQVLPDRQRKDLGDITDLAGSIERLGLINPITLDENMVLRAGERRLRAWEWLVANKGWPAKIDARLTSDLSPDQLHLVELDENIRRKQLTWQEEALSIYDYHELLARLNPGWTLDKTAAESGISPVQLDRARAIAPEIRKDPRGRFAACDSLGGAYALYTRIAQREQESELSKISVKSIFEPEPDGEPIGAEGLEVELGDPVPDPMDGPRPAEADIQQTNFREWVRTYEGPKFNLIHCDFPYGVGMHKSGQVNPGKWGTYVDTKDVYEDLLHDFLNYRDVFMEHSCHVVFWLSARWDIQLRTRQLISALAPELVVNPVPLVWHKSDNRGILPDPERGPRQTYETALFLSRGDRKIITAVANSYSAPTAKVSADHVSQKPQPVLAHFFRMVVDEFSTVLDPTCGSGTALCAAEALKASRVLGMDLDPENVQVAQDLLNRQRKLAYAEEVL